MHTERFARYVGLRCATLRHISKSLALFSRTSGSASYFLFRACQALNSCVSSIERASLLSRAASSPPSRRATSTSSGGPAIFEYLDDPRYSQSRNAFSAVARGYLTSRSRRSSALARKNSREHRVHQDPRRFSPQQDRWWRSKHVLTGSSWSLQSIDTRMVFVQHGATCP